ncbi:MAG: hydroxyacid dehydrogenase, partial [Clostridia bacterium]|nr:hydroxyacid dehydrogenase [Clostridia bacterium]
MKTFVNVGAWVRDSFFSPATRERLEKLGEVAYCEGNALGGDELRRAVRGFDVVMTGWAQPTVHAADIPGVKMVLHTGGTVGGIVDPDVFDAGIPVLSGNRYYAESVAEGVIAYMLFALRDMGYYSSELKAGRWQPTHNEGLLD